MMSNLDAPNPNREEMLPEVREGVAQKLRETFEKWRALPANAAKATSEEMTNIWNDIMTAEVRVADKESDKALERAAEAMKNAGILKTPLPDLIENSRNELRI